MNNKIQKIIRKIKLKLTHLFKIIFVNSDLCNLLIYYV